MSRVPLRGYADFPSVCPGENLTFRLNCDVAGPVTGELIRLIKGDARPDGPTSREEVVEEFAPVTFDVSPQRTQSGSYVQIPDPAGTLIGGGGLSIQLFLWPTTVGKARQGVIGRYDDASGRGWLLSLENGKLVFTIGDGDQTASVGAEFPLFPEVWYSVVASFDPGAGRLTLAHRCVRNRVNSRVGLVVDLQTDSSANAPTTIAPTDSHTPVVIGGIAESGDPARTWVIHSFNGKIDAPGIYGPGAVPDFLPEACGARADNLIARWDFSAGVSKAGIGTDLVPDLLDPGLGGECLNQPDRGMTGWNWDGSEENFVHAPELYGALWFHEDSLDDCRWDPSMSITVPEGLPSGAYALRTSQYGYTDQIPFFVLPPRGTATAKVLFLVPTFTYLAYANSQVMQNADVAQVVMGVITVLEARDLELHEDIGQYGLSLYDNHADGRGVQYSTWRRPILNMRPGYRHEYGSTWGFPADLDVIAWLTAQHIDFDVATDHDLVTEGPELLKRYSAVLTGSHPEYYSGQMLDAWEDYLSDGGRGMYLGGNGFYWITTPHPEKGWLVEVRRGESGDQAWRARPGELFHSTTGERGGLWRHRGRAPQKLWGVGYVSHCLDSSTGYVMLPDAAEPSTSWITEGIDISQRLGEFGHIGGGAAGLEVDHVDVALGTPPHVMLLGSSTGLSVNAMLVPEEQYFSYPGMNGREHPSVRADLTYFTTPSGGAVFSVGSISWCGSLAFDDYNNNISRITGNVLRRFMADEPVPAVY